MKKYALAVNLTKRLTLTAVALKAMAKPLNENSAVFSGFGLVLGVTKCLYTDPEDVTHQVGLTSAMA